MKISKLNILLMVVVALGLVQVQAVELIKKDSPLILRLFT